MTTYIKQYIRRGKNNQPVGVMVAEKIDGKIHIGWSITHKRDTYNKQKGELIAANRLKAYTGELKVPSHMLPDMLIFIDRCQFYFRTEKNEFLTSLSSSLKY